MKNFGYFALGLISTLYFSMNTLFWTLLLFLAFILKAILPVKSLRRHLYSLMVALAKFWIKTNILYIDTFLPTKLSVSVPSQLSPNNSYLVISNHRSWVDILMLQYALNDKTPFLRFFIKDTLRWVPLLGQAWMALDFPFMKRLSISKARKNPEQKNQDIIAAKNACARLLGKAACVLIFLEGTRFTHRKKETSNSVFTNLLRPKIGGSAAVLDVLGQQLTSIVDVTLVYPKGDRNFWEFMCGKLEEVIIEARELEIPEKFLQGNLEKSNELRIELNQWAHSIWTDKDLRLSKFL